MCLEGTACAHGCLPETPQVLPGPSASKMGRACMCERASGRPPIGEACGLRGRSLRRASPCCRPGSIVSSRRSACTPRRGTLLGRHGESGGRLAWLVAPTKGQLEGMVEDFVTHAEAKSLAVQWEKFKCWSLRRSDQLQVHGSSFVADQDMQFLGLSLVTGGTPTVEARIASAWKAFHANRPHLTSRCLSKKVRWEPRPEWKRQVDLHGLLVVGQSRLVHHIAPACPTTPKANVVMRRSPT